MGKGRHKTYPRFHADFEVLSCINFVEAFARRDPELSDVIYRSYTPITFARSLEIAVEQNRLSIPPGTKTDMMMRGRFVLESALVEAGVFAGAQHIIDWQLDVGIIDQQTWDRCSIDILDQHEEITIKFAQQTAFFLREIEKIVNRRGLVGRPSPSEAAWSLTGYVDSGLLNQAAQPTRDDPENSFDGMMRRLKPIVRNAIKDHVLPRHNERRGQSLDDAVSKHMKRLERLAKDIKDKHTQAMQGKS